MPVIQVTMTKIPASEFTVLIHGLDRENVGRSGRTCADIMAEVE